MAGIFGTTDYSKATQRYNDGSYFDIVLGDGVTAIGKEYRANTAIRSIVIPSSVTAWPTGTIEVLGNNVFSVTIISYSHNPYPVDSFD